MTFPKVTASLLNKKQNPSLIPCPPPGVGTLKRFHPSIYPSIHLLIHFLRIYECIGYHISCVVDKVFRINFNSSEMNFTIDTRTIFDLSTVEILFMSTNLCM